MGFGEFIEECVSCSCSLLFHELVDGCQSEDDAERVLVDADDGQLFRNVESEVASCEDRADGHLI
ncbi:hypothetical protein AC792_03125 [Arthrobacter sp. RIT-PI-e]|nr:hypothetical protein AC792_03125 [Arthrobacter sp. RIT-PI-e]